jgi:hypothetical protein
MSYDPFRNYAIVRPPDAIQEGDFYKYFNLLTGEFDFAPVKVKDSNVKRRVGTTVVAGGHVIIRPTSP